MMDRGIGRINGTRQKQHLMAFPFLGEKVFENDEPRASCVTVGNRSQKTFFVVITP
jgi:hypothetical protein